MNIKTKSYILFTCEILQMSPLVSSAFQRIIDKITATTANENESAYAEEAEASFLKLSNQSQIFKIIGNNLRVGFETCSFNSNYFAYRNLLFGYVRILSFFSIGWFRTSGSGIWSDCAVLQKNGNSTRECHWNHFLVEKEYILDPLPSSCCGNLKMTNSKFSNVLSPLLSSPGAVTIPWNPSLAQ